MQFKFFCNPKHSRMALIVLLLISILFLQGCDPFFFDYPYEKGSYWLCEDPYFSIKYSYREDSSIVNGHEAFLEYDGIIQQVIFAARPSFFEVDPKEQKDSGGIDYNSRLLDGRWEYEHGNLVLHIKTDKVFDGKYSDIVLVCKDKRPVKISMPAVIFAVGVLAGASYLIVKRHNNKKKGTQE